MESHTITLNESWYIIESEEITGDEKEISSPSIDLSGWIPTSVPATVLGALIRNNIYTDPYFGKNLESIPTTPFQNPWWYRKEFKIKYNSHQYYCLIFEGINYRADIWLNGQKIASSDTLKGSFRIFKININPFIHSGVNSLAVKVLPPQPGDFTIGFVDWNPNPPDQNMGLWRGVKLKAHGSVSINNPFVQSKINLKTLDEAELIINMELVNHSNQQVSGKLSLEIEDIHLNQLFTLRSHERKEIKFTPDKYSVLSIKNPRLWWPNNHGNPNLYTCSLKILLGNNISDTTSVRFGIREVSDYINMEGHRGYKINGKKILIRGGGWVDGLMLEDDAKKIESQIKYAKHMNLNTIRLEGFWGSSQTLYNLADKYGILIMAGWSCHWEWEDYLGGPVDRFGGIQTEADMRLVSRYLKDQVIWLRNHPSILLWALGSDKPPRPALEKKYIALLENSDPTRPFLSSCGAMTSEISGPTGVKMNGPYDYVTPNYWTIDKKNGGAFGFNTESGPGPQPPPLESIQKMIPKNHLWPIDNYWNFHCGRNQFNTLEKYLDAFNHRYGTTTSVQEFAFKAQVANYEAMRAMFEAFTINKNNTTGIIQWMFNSAWPEMYWQLFDWFLMPNGAFYGARTGCKPLNIVYNYGDQNIYLINDFLTPFERLKAEIRILNVDSKELIFKQIPIKILENSSEKIFRIPELDNLSLVYFLDLKLKDATGKVLCSNFYWLSLKEDSLDFKNTTWYWTPNNSFGDFSLLNKLKKIKIDVEHRFTNVGHEKEIEVTLNNPTETIAFFIELNVYDKKSGESILPIFWEDNYISLLPGEKKQFHARFSKEDLKGKTPCFRYQGWNVKHSNQFSSRE